MDEAKRTIFVRAVRRKPAHATTEEFWNLIDARRREPTLSAEEVEESISAGAARNREDDGT